MFGSLSRMGSHLRQAPAKRVLIVNGHPDPGPRRYCAALCAAYAEGAQASGYTTQRLDVGALSGDAGDRRSVDVLELLWRADRLFIGFPMWLGGPPLALQKLLDVFARWHSSKAGEPAKDMHIVVTASLPGLIYRTNRGAPIGEWAKPVAGRCISQAILIGSVETMSQEDRRRWLSTVRRLGASSIECVPGRVALG